MQRVCLRAEGGTGEGLRERVGLGFGLGVRARLRVGQVSPNLAHYLALKSGPTLNLHLSHNLPAFGSVE
jgi:hypothetical protein